MTLVTCAQQDGAWPGLLTCLVPTQPHHSACPEGPACGQNRDRHKLWASSTDSVGPDCPSWGCKSPHKRPDPGTHRERGWALRASPPVQRDSDHAWTQGHKHAARAWPCGTIPGARRAAPPPPRPTPTACRDNRTGEQLPTHDTAAPGRAGGGQEGDGARGHPEQAAEQTLPHTRQQTVDRGGNGAGKGPVVQGWAASPPSGFRSALNQPALGKGSHGPLASWGVWCVRTMGSPAHTGQSCLRQAGGQGGQLRGSCPQVHSRGARLMPGEKAHPAAGAWGRALSGFQNPQQAPSCLERASFGSERKGCWNQGDPSSPP